MRKRGFETMIGHWLRPAALAAAVCGLMAVPSTAFAQGEVSGVIGGMLGGDLNNILEGNFSVGGAFDNGPLYGVRAGWMSGFIGLEGSFVGSPSGISISAPNHPVGVDGKVYYTEGNALFF